MFFDFLLGRRMAAAEDEDTVGDDKAAEMGDAAPGDEYDDVDEAGNGSTDTAVRVEDVLRQLTEAEQKEEDDSLQASFSGISEEDRLVLMQFLPQLEPMKEKKNDKDLAEKDSSSDKNPLPYSNGFVEQEPSLMEKSQPPSTNRFVKQEPSLMVKSQPPFTNGFVEQEPPLMQKSQPSSTIDLAEPVPSPETKPLPQVADSLAEQEDSPEADPQPPSSNSNALPLHEPEQELRKERKREDSDRLGEIMKELKSIKRQQTITHCLVSVLIVVTAIWQYSEASIALSVKDTVSHPFRAIGGFFSRALLGGEKTQILDNMPSPPSIPQLEVSQLSNIKPLELPHPRVDFASAVIGSVED